MTNLELIKKYKKMKSIGKLCKQEGIFSQNLLQGRSTRENEAKIAELCKNEIIQFCGEVIKENDKTDTL